MFFTDFLFSSNEEWEYATCRKKEATGDGHVKWNTPDIKWQMSILFFHMQNLELNKHMCTHVHTCNVKV